MSRNAFVLILAVAALAAVLAMWKMARPAPADCIAVSEPHGSGTVTDPPALKDRARSGKAKGSDCPRPAPKPNVDESPWPESSGAWPAQDSPQVNGDPMPQSAQGEGLPDLESARQTLRSMDASHDRREAIRRMLAGGEAELAAALAMYWSSQPDEPWVRDFLATVRTSAPYYLAEWLADSAVRASDPSVRARFRGLLAELQGPAAVEAVTFAALETPDVALRQDLLVLLGERRAASEVDVLADALLVEDAEVNAAAARGLVSIGGAHAYESLRARAADPERADMIWEALGVTHSPFGQNALLGLAVDTTQSIAVRTAAVHSLAQSRSERVLAVLRNGASANTEPSVAAAVQIAVAALREECEVRRTSVAAVGFVREDERWF